MAVKHGGCAKCQSTDQEILISTLAKVEKEIRGDTVTLIEPLALCDRCRAAELRA